MGAASSTEAATSLAQGGGVSGATPPAECPAHIHTGITPPETKPTHHSTMMMSGGGECPVKHDSNPGTYVSDCPAAMGQMAAGDIDPRNMVRLKAWM